MTKPKHAVATSKTDTLPIVMNAVEQIYDGAEPGVVSPAPREEDRSSGRTSSSSRRSEWLAVLAPRGGLGEKAWGIVQEPDSQSH